ncbi:MAG: DNA cytosine methyltransferase [Rhodospirillales bacterium]|nr:MAG: DNA cytosine methyltransferase [Rhodospirillales bacterium]
MGRFYEFFAGGGMARAGLGPGWSCLLSNDIDPKKGASYARNWGASELRLEDVGELRAADMPETADLAWASFPCQDLSLAGTGAGLRGERSGTFWPFWNLMKALDDEDRAPPMIVLENVCGALTSHGGKDFAAIGAAIADAGYRFGALVIDAVDFVPQSRPRLFIVAVGKDYPIPDGLTQPASDEQWHTGALVEAHDRLSKRARDSWLWWRLPLPPKRNTVFADLIEEKPKGVPWHTAAETRKLLDMMSPVNKAKVQAAKKAGRRMVGAIYKRTRSDGNGGKMQRAEIRFDDIAGCLRTPAGGSSRQTIMLVDGNKVRSRLLSPREAARLMGLPDDYELPENYNEAYHLAGDGVVVPVVRHIAENILEPMLAAIASAEKEAA